MSRKKTLIDKKFQLKTVFSIFGIVYLILTIVITVIGITAAINNQKLADMIRGHKKIVSTQYNTVSSLLVIYQKKSWEELEKATDKASADTAKNMEVVLKNIETTRMITRNNNIMLISIIVFIILQGVVLYFVLLRMTHRISGPLYLLTNYFREITDGKYPDVRPLRKGDEFQELYDEFGGMVETLRRKGALD